MHQPDFISFPADSIELQQETCQLLVPFVGYRVRFFNQILDQLGEVSHFILIAAGSSGLDLSSLLPKLGLSPVQMQNLLQRLQQLNLLDVQNHLTQEGHAAVDFLTQGWQGKTATLWFEQTYKPGSARIQPLIITEASILHERDYWPKNWPERPLFQGRSSTQIQNQALQAELQAFARRQLKGDRIKQAHQAMFLRLFPEAEVFLNKHPRWSLSYELEPLQQEVGYYALSLPLPGQQDIWKPAKQEVSKSPIYLWPLVQAQVTYKFAEGFSTFPPDPELWQHFWCAHSGRSIKPEEYQRKSGTASVSNPETWLELLADQLPEESPAKQLMTRQIAFASLLTTWKLDEQQVKKHLSEKLESFRLSI